ncbi:MAG: ribosome maturation factor RimP [Lachnospiraceae bacterium]|nr:ribosome maturation factor RimP [Lachnospiraceae bacterium]
MSRHEDYVKRTEELLEPIARANSVSIYDVEFVNEAGEWYLRAYIDKEGGVTIEDCEAVSRALSDEIDKYDYIEEAYYLEVSSPGLGRTLKKDKHLQSALGQEVELKTYKPVDKVKEFAGVLKAFDAKTVTLTIDGADRDFERSNIALIKLALDI